jgi:hypothetical protein
MIGTSSRQFGIIIGYVLPGFVALGGLAPLFPTIAYWLQPVSASQYDLGLGPPLYAILAATALGQVLSCFRWILLDQLHAFTGLRRPAWEDSQLDRVLSGFDYLVQNHFRYYEFCGNTLLALFLTYAANRTLGTLAFLNGWTDLGMAIVIAVLFLASRNALKTYYTRTSRLIGRAQLETSCTTTMATTTVATGKNQRPLHLPNHRAARPLQRRPLDRRTRGVQSDRRIGSSRLSRAPSIAEFDPPQPDAELRTSPVID